MGKAKCHSGNLIGEAKPQDDVGSKIFKSMGGVYGFDSVPSGPLARTEISRYTLFLRHYGSHKSDPSGGFPVEN
jgi:hypothetical protein